ncbi:TPA: hypothetical protein ACGO8M_001832 [Streptococcus suis]
MKLRVLKPFGDHEAKLIRQIGEEFEVTKERFTILSARVPPDFYEVIKSKAKKAEE